jgi:hypothetical protein
MLTMGPLADHCQHCQCLSRPRAGFFKRGWTMVCRQLEDAVKFSGAQKQCRNVVAPNLTNAQIPCNTHDPSYNPTWPDPKLFRTSTDVL